MRHAESCVFVYAHAQFGTQMSASRIIDGLASYSLLGACWIYVSILGCTHPVNVLRLIAHAIRYWIVSAFAPHRNCECDVRWRAKRARALM